MQGVALKPEPKWYQRSRFVLLRGLVTAQSVAGFLMFCAAWFSRAVGDYNWAVTLVIPMIMGAVCAYCWQSLAGLSRWTVFWMCCLNTLLGCFLAAIFVHEGLICLLMASPLLLTLVTISANMTLSLLQARSGPARVSIVPVLAVMFVSGFFARSDWSTAVTTEMRVNAPPSAVYPFIVAFPEIKRPSDFWLCRFGLPYPVGTTADGAFVGAHRSCQFSGNLALGEKITRVVPNQEVDFDVVDPLRYPEIANHASLHHGRIAIVDNGDGTSTLVGTTWYSLHVAPGAYFGLWSEYLIHQGHQRVFTQIKLLAEKRAPLAKG